MRDREDIENAASSQYDDDYRGGLGRDIEPSAEDFARLQLEVMLDIRDLLVDIKVGMMNMDIPAKKVARIKKVVKNA